MAEYEEYGDTAFASTFASIMMPEQNVSTRTETTRIIGGFEITKHLIGGDWGDLSLEVQEPLVREFLARALANAARQGIVIEQTVESVEEATYALPERPNEREIARQAIARADELLATFPEGIDEKEFIHMLKDDMHILLRQAVLAVDHWNFPKDSKTNKITHPKFT